MISKCANVDCAKPFDYREGRFFRFHQDVGVQTPNAHAVAHFWLCGSCSDKYTLAQRRQPFSHHDENRPIINSMQDIRREEYPALAVWLTPRARLSPEPA